MGLGAVKGWFSVRMGKKIPTRNLQENKKRAQIQAENLDLKIRKDSSMGRPHF